MQHITVLQNEAVDALALTPSSTVVDATLGSGGHANAITAQLGPQGTYIGIDADVSAVVAAEAWKDEVKCNVELVTGNFRTLTTILDNLQIASVDAVLADLGWRTDQFEESGKGFSFKHDEPLTMTFGEPSQYPFTAADIINEWSEESLRNVLIGYGEERFAHRIVKVIAEHRAHEPIATTGTLVECIEKAVPAFYRNGKIHPATKTFQALRIAVNDEFQALESFIPQAIEALRPGGRLAIISFHSLEDRIVKHTFRNYAHDHQAVLVNKKPITASEDELKANPRARSAKLRIIEKQPGTEQP